MDIPSMIIGAGIAMLLANVWVWFVLPRWHDRGRRRDQRRTEARLRAYQEEHSRPAVMGYFLPKSERPPFTGPEEENGATEPRPPSSRATGTTTDAKNG